MITTAIVAEILIIGLQLIIWLFILSIAICGFDFLNPEIFSNLEGWTGLVTIFTIGFAYTSGTVVDRVADSLFAPFDRMLIKKTVPSHLPPIPEVKLIVMIKNKETSDFINYVRSRVRITRSTALNMFFGIVSVNLLLLKQWTINSFAFIVYINIVQLFVFLLILFAWYRISKTYYERLVQAYQISV